MEKEFMKLQELKKYEEITIQCHDNPDADAIGSGYGLYCYFKKEGKKVRLIYSGRSEIQKSNLKLMVEKLNIPVEYQPDDKEKIMGLLITVDCQYGAGNVTKLKAENVAIIDHHQLEIVDVELSHILSDIGSCSTIVWMMLKEAGFDVNQNEKLSTALYYGLLTDTNHFTEIHNPNDRDMQDTLSYNRSLITLFCNSNISLQELEVAGIAMLRCSFNEDYHFAVIKSQPCDANILGLISDFLLQVDQIHTCVVFNELEGGYKLSVRSCIREVNASELASFLTKDIGNGGGHYQKAGGFVSKKLYEEKMENMHAEAYFNSRMVEYFDYFELIYADKYQADFSNMKKYQKKNIPLGYVKATDILPIGTPITIRTLEGDIDMTIEDDLIIMIGIEGEVYPNRLEKFERAYKKIDQKYIYSECVINNQYEPVVKNQMDGKKVPLADYANVCVSTGNVQIYAKPLNKAVKIFTSWDPEKYMVGKVGDYLAVKTDDTQDVYVVDQTVFDKTYARMEKYW